MQEFTTEDEDSQMVCGLLSRKYSMVVSGKVRFGHNISYDIGRIQAEWKGLFILNSVSFKIQNRSMIVF